MMRVVQHSMKRANMKSKYDEVHAVSIVGEAYYIQLVQRWANRSHDPV
jgi:hypothetical protein